MRSTIAGVVAVVMMTGMFATGCKGSSGGGGDNVLLGSWVLISPEPGKGCNDHITFKEHSQTNTYLDKKSEVPIDHYIIEPTQIFVAGDAGIANAVQYVIMSHDQIKIPGPYGDCVWKRA
jgi:hypothetical protein